MPWPTRSPVLFLIFNRPDTTALVFERIRLARPARLYVAADGPRPQRAGESELCEQTRALIRSVDWPCSVLTLFRDTNLGCRNAVSAALAWFFSQEEEGIVLEDDCVPNDDFFRFCDTLLEHYRHDARIRHIAGCNLQHGRIRGDASYYYSRITHIWGWASWRRVWADYDPSLRNCDPDAVERALQNTYPEPLIARHWRHILGEIQSGRLDTWDFQLSLTNLLQGGLAVIPNRNLVTNLGFGPGATHTRTDDDPNASLPTEELDAEITHPAWFVPDLAADLHTLTRDFDLDRRKAEAREAARLGPRIRRWVKDQRRAIKRSIIR